MSTIVVTPRSENAIPFLMELPGQLPDVKQVEVLTGRSAEKTRLYKDIDAGLKEIKAVMEGKKHAKTAEQFLDEI
jgi:hypothetical protein